MALRISGVRLWNFARCCRDSASSLGGKYCLLKHFLSLMQKLFVKRARFEDSLRLAFNTWHAPLGRLINSPRRRTHSAAAQQREQQRLAQRRGASSKTKFVISGFRLSTGPWTLDKQEHRGSRLLAGEYTILSTPNSNPKESNAQPPE